MVDRIVSYNINVYAQEITKCFTKKRCKLHYNLLNYRTPTNCGIRNLFCDCRGTNFLFFLPVTIDKAVVPTLVPKPQLAACVIVALVNQLSSANWKWFSVYRFKYVVNKNQEEASEEN